MTVTAVSDEWWDDLGDDELHARLARRVGVTAAALLVIRREHDRERERIAEVLR